MKKSRFTETQIVSILNEGDAGMAVKDVCRAHDISPSTYFKWKSKCGGLSASELKRIKELEAENSKLKRMFADLSLENDALKHLIEKGSSATRTQRSRERCLVIEIDTSLPGARLVRTLEQIKASQGVPKAIRCDNGPELLPVRRSG